MTQKGHNFWSDRWIAPKFLQDFPEVIFLGVAMESLLNEEEVWSGQTWVTTIKRHNFSSYRWIALKYLQVFSEVVFLRVATEWLLIENEV